MVTLKLKTVSFKAFGREQKLDYKALLQTLMEAPADPQRGATIDEIRKSIRVLNCLEDAKDTVALEDSDYEYLLQRIKSARYTSSNNAFIDFVEDIESAKDNHD